MFNSLRPRQNGRHFPDNIFKCIFMNENIQTTIKISLKFVPRSPIDNNPALVVSSNEFIWQRLICIFSVFLSGSSTRAPHLSVRFPWVLCSSAVSCGQPCCRGYQPNWLLPARLRFWMKRRGRKNSVVPRWLQVCGTASLSEWKVFYSLASGRLMKIYKDWISNDTMCRHMLSSFCEIALA